MRNDILALWRLWRLLRALGRDGERMKAASFSVIVEPESRFEERTRVAVANGEQAPDRLSAWEVVYAPDASAPAMARKAPTLAEALERALERPTRDSADPSLVLGGR